MSESSGGPLSLLQPPLLSIGLFTPLSDILFISKWLATHCVNLIGKSNELDNLLCKLFPPVQPSSYTDKAPIHAPFSYGSCTLKYLVSLASIESCVSTEGRPVAFQRSKRRRKAKINEVGKWKERADTQSGPPAAAAAPPPPDGALSLSPLLHC
ncbi:hypothetical protein EVAR_94291_1 [Eumeta japonica]|uniref:Uncharacterized protein n=1 Tax=Eumeta variegata TaxID=151549 RepID=A0A4C1UFV0_EUMVA|nr:hypothetical protein EVAR_94291_1 [Eumeta japonica]